MLTIFAVMFPLAAAFKGLRHPLYALHIAVLAGLMFILNRDVLTQETLFAAPLILPLCISHLASINLVTYLAYYMDKRASRRGSWRISERTLHHMAFIGGSPAALLAQKTLRHKTQKTAFRRIFLLIAALQALAITLIISYLLT